MPWQYLASQGNTLPTIQESFPISSSQGGKSAAQQDGPEKGCPAHYPAEHSPGTFIQAGPQPAAAKGMTSTSSSGCEGQAGPLPSREERIKPGLGKEWKKKHFSPPPPHYILTEQGQQRQSHPAPSLHLTSSPPRFACTSHSRKRKIQPEGPRCPLPRTAWPHLRHGLPSPKMHLVDKTFSSLTPRQLFPTQPLPTEKPLLHQVAAKDPGKGFNLQNSWVMGGRGTLWESPSAWQLTHPHGAETRDHSALSPDSHPCTSSQRQGKGKEPRLGLNRASPWVWGGPR